MQDPQAAAARIAGIFERIHRERMAGLPLLNERLQVEVLGFQVYEGRVLGILITPWLMNLVLLPGEQDHWEDLTMGHKEPHVFPAGTYKFMVNEIEEIGACQTHSLYSPMREFQSQAHVRAAAEAILRDLMTTTVSPASGPDANDAELLGRILRGEDTPEIDLDALEHGSLVEVADGSAARRLTEIPVRVEETTLSRRDLLRGRFRGV